MTHSHIFQTVDYNVSHKVNSFKKIKLHVRRRNYSISEHTQYMWNPFGRGGEKTTHRCRARRGTIKCGETRSGVLGLSGCPAGSARLGPGPGQDSGDERPVGEPGLSIEKRCLFIFHTQSYVQCRGHSSKLHAALIEW